MVLIWNKFYSPLDAIPCIFWGIVHAFGRTLWEMERKNQNNVQRKSEFVRFMCIQSKEMKAAVNLVLICHSRSVRADCLAVAVATSLLFQLNIVSSNRKTINIIRFLMCLPRWANEQNVDCIAPQQTMPNFYLFFSIFFFRFPLCLWTILLLNAHYKVPHNQSMTKTTTRRRWSEWKTTIFSPSKREREIYMWIYDDEPNQW